MAKKKTRKNYGLAAFLERHTSGETDFHDFVMHAKFKVHKTMIDMGCAIEQFQELDKEAIIVYLIEKGYGQEKYEAWKKHPDLTVRKALAAKGLWPETFIKDKKYKVRCAVAEKHPDYLLELMDSDDTDQWFMINRLMRSMANPKAEYLQKFIDRIGDIHRGYWVPQTEAYELQLAALQKPLTTLEKTLPREQLKAMGNPHWTDNLTAVEISAELNN